MSSNIPLPSTPPPDPKARELVSKLRTKTAAGKLHWDKVMDGFVARAAPVTVRFYTNTNPLAGSVYWTRFVVESDEGVVLDVAASLNLLQLISGALAQDPVRTEVNELFGDVSRKAEGKVERAINVLDKL